MQKILVIRNDKLGDFMLAWPAFALLKKSNPQLKLTALVPAYTAPLAQICPFLDDVIIDAKKDDKADFARLLKEVKAAQFDGLISFFSNSHNAKLAWQSGIKYRLAPATKIYQFLYNHRLTQRRSRSEKPEFAYNQDLARAFLQRQQMPIIETAPPYLQFSAAQIQAQKAKLSQLLQIDESKKWLFVHSGSGGSANNLSLAQYAELVRNLLAQFDVYVLLTAGPNESEQAHQLADLIQDPRVRIYDKNEGLVDFAHSLACADLFIAGSTGPLHLSAALNVPTVGFYPAKRSATPLRWQPINEPAKHLPFSPPADKQSETDMAQIKIAEISPRLIEFAKTFLA